MIKKEELQRKTKDGAKSLVNLGLEWISRNFETEAKRNADKAYNSVYYPNVAGSAIPGKVADGIISKLKEDAHFSEFEIEKIRSTKGGYYVAIKW